MPKQEGQKTKLLALLHIFEQKTDENHLLNVPQLVELLEQQGILAERKSIYSDIDTLCALGYDIQLRRGRGGGTFADGGHHACNEGGHSRFIAVLGQSQQVIGDFLHGASSGRQMRTPL